MGLLYHYTKLDTFLNYILPSEKLMANYLDLTNDPRESMRWAFGSTNLPYEQIFPDYYSEDTHNDCQFKFGDLIKNRIQIICFSGAKGKGWNNEMMWAHYGEGHMGVCLEFDEEMLKNNLKTFNCVIEEVIYERNNKRRDNWIHWDGLNDIEFNIRQTIERLYPYIALTKSYFWDQEDEKRLVVFNEENRIFIPIQNALKAVHFGVKFDVGLLPKIGRELLSKNIEVYRLIYQNEKYERWNEKVQNLDEIEAIKKLHKVT